MTALDPATVRAVLRDFLAEQVLAEGVVLSDDSQLAEAGVDSFALMELVLFVERRFGVVVPMEQLTPVNVRTVEALAGVVVGVRGAR